jgi:hypothetical protein
MTDAPETIWVTPSVAIKHWMNIPSLNRAPRIEYTRTAYLVAAQARIAELEAALAPFAAMVQPNNFDPKGIARFGVSGRAGNDDYRAAYAALKETS